MGFGWLLIGYFIATFMTLHSFGALVRVIGYGIVLLSVWRLRQYHKAFHWMGLGTVLLFLFSLVLACSDTSNFFYSMLWINRPLFSERAIPILGYIEQGITFVFQALMLYSIRAIAKETEVTKIANNTVRNFVFVCLYYVVYLVSLLPVESVKASAGELAWIAWVLYLVWQVLNLVLIGSCYMRICDESDQEMQQKPSRFAFINRFREENERRSKKAREEYEEYRNEKRAKRRKK